MEACSWITLDQPASGQRLQADSCRLLLVSVMHALQLIKFYEDRVAKIDASKPQVSGFVCGGPSRAQLDRMLFSGGWLALWLCMGWG